MPNLSYRFTGGWANFFADSLRIRCCIGSSPVTVTPGAAYASATSGDYAFGGRLLSNSEFIRSIFRSGEHFLIRPEALSPKDKTEWFRLIENEQLTPGPVHSCVFVLYQRENCRLTNAWLDGFSSKGMVTNLASLSRFFFQHLTIKGKRPLPSSGNWERCALH